MALLCPHCRTSLSAGSLSCTNCGSALEATRTPLAIKPSNDFGQVFGLEPRMALLTFLVDAMLFGGDFVTGPFIALFSVPAGLTLGYLTYRAQLTWYGDDEEFAKIKAGIVGLLTAIPVGIPVLISGASGLVGFLYLIGRKDQRK
jgi:hypothetical protein